MIDRDSIAQAYDNLAKFSPGLFLLASDGLTLVDAWDALIHESVEHARILQLNLKIEYVEYEPYTTARAMFADLENWTMRVSVLDAEHPLWTLEQNLAFRIAHDTLGHWKTGTAHNRFNFKGEIAAYRAQGRHLRSPAAKRALFTEVIGQAAYRGTYGEFPSQKIGFIGGTDNARL